MLMRAATVARLAGLVLCVIACLFYLWSLLKMYSRILHRHGNNTYTAPATESEITAAYYNTRRHDFKGVNTVIKAPDSIPLDSTRLEIGVVNKFWIFCCCRTLNAFVHHHLFVRAKHFVNHTNKLIRAFPQCTNSCSIVWLTRYLPRNAL